MATRSPSGQDGERETRLHRTSLVPGERARKQQDAPSRTLPDLETVRGAARRGQTERAIPIGIRAVKHDLGALEFRADDQADSRRQNVDGALSSSKGAVRLGTASSSGRVTQTLL